MALFKNKRGDEESEPIAYPANPAPVFPNPTPAPVRTARGETMANIGKSLRIKGDVLSAAVMADSADNTQPLLRLARNSALGHVARHPLAQPGVHRAVLQGARAVPLQDAGQRGR